MKSPVVKRSIVIAGHKTSVSLEDAFWTGLKEIAGGRGMTLSELVAAIDQDRRHGNLSSAIRLFVLDHYRSQVIEEKAEHAPARDLAAARAAAGLITRKPPASIGADQRALALALVGQAGFPNRANGSAPAKSAFGLWLPYRMTRDRRRQSAVDLFALARTAERSIRFS
jgi:predicted DNA-binding ribbon-helix-helix protein